MQSGKVVFDYEIIDSIKLANNTENKTYEIFGFSVKIIIRTEEELINIVNNNPFVDDPNIEIDKLYVTFMVDIPDPNLVLVLNIKKKVMKNL
ncbi:DUF1697 domain-containing protein [Clostridium estertheticum]|nr:DUF1697 domain-containing protein [Clostridium estertheticum]